MRLGGWFRRDGSASIQALNASHAPRLADIHGTAFTRPWDAFEFERCLADRSIFADGVFLRGRAEPVGFVLSRRVADEAEILSVAMAPEARGFGYARPLLDRHLQALAQAGVRDVFLEVEEGNRPAHALYRGHGFREIGHRAGYYARPDGTRAAAITMGRRL
jgi:ribosomal-protein-alanine N-acetyltransferase